MIARVIATPGALALLDRLRERHGPLLLRPTDSRDGNPAVCLPRAQHAVGPDDLLLGEVGGCPVYVDRTENQQWQLAQLIVDVTDAPDPGTAALRARSRRFSTEEWAELNALAPAHAVGRRPS